MLLVDVIALNPYNITPQIFFYNVAELQPPNTPPEEVTVCQGVAHPIYISHYSTETTRADPVFAHRG